MFSRFFPILYNASYPSMFIWHSWGNKLGGEFNLYIIPLITLPLVHLLKPHNLSSSWFPKVRQSPYSMFFTTSRPAAEQDMTIKVICKGIYFIAKRDHYKWPARISWGLSAITLLLPNQVFPIAINKVLPSGRLPLGFPSHYKAKKTGLSMYGQVCDALFILSLPIFEIFPDHLLATFASKPIIMFCMGVNLWCTSLFCW